jgi:hypothetical protein
VHVFGANAKNDLLCPCAGAIPWPFFRHCQAEATGVDLEFAVALHQRGVEEVHAGAADETGNEHVARVIVQNLRRVDLVQQSHPS